MKMVLSSWETSHVLWKLDGIMSTVCLEDPFWSTPGAALLDATTVKTFLERTCYVQVTFLRKFPTGAFSLILSIIVRVFVSVHQRPDGHQAEVPDWSRPRLGFFAIPPLLRQVEWCRHLHTLLQWHSGVVTTTSPVSFFFDKKRLGKCVAAKSLIENRNATTSFQSQEWALTER